MLNSRTSIKASTAFVIGIGLSAATVVQADFGTAFTYQGVLENPPGQVVNDTCAFEFALCDDAMAACSPGTVSSHPAVEVTFGVFTVAEVDFGDNGCNGEARWMEISVKCSGDASFITLSPRVELKPAPYSIRAGSGVGGPNALNVTPIGNVGIGTATPQAQLDVSGAARATSVEITGGEPLVKSLVGWGDNRFDQDDIPSGMFIAAAAGYRHGLAIRTDGTLVGWGNNDVDQADPPSGTFTAVSASNQFSMAIRTDGTLAQWGADIGTPPSGTFTAVAAGVYWFGVAIRSDGTLVGWGNNDFGQTDVPLGTFIKVAAGFSHSLAIRTDGTLVGWGSNDYGQTDVPSGTFTAVAAGGYHGVAIRTDGTLVGWGYNQFGQTDVPVGTFIAVAAGEAHSVAIRSDGTLTAWGCGVGSNLGQCNVPSGMFTAVAAGGYFSLAINSNASLPEPALRLHTDSATKPGSNTWTIYSDRRLKKDIEPLSGALERLTQLHGVTFNWRNPASQGGITGRQIGLLADEVQHVFPQWVGRDPKGYQTLTVGGFEALTAEAVRELREEKDRQLEQRDCEIEDLKSQISDLKEMVKALSTKQGEGGK